MQGKGLRLLAETSDEDALRREAIAVARRLGPKRAELNVERPGAAERFLQLSVGDLYLEIENGRVRLDVGVTPGGVAEDLDDTPRYRDAQRRLGGAPTLLVERPSGYVAARRAGAHAADSASRAVRRARRGARARSSATGSSSSPSMTSASPADLADHTRRRRRSA